MPFTPYHMGPGLAIKSFAGRHFSLLMFGLAQVAIDIEPGIGLIRGSEVLHGWTHTYLGATLIALAVLAFGRPFCLLLLRRWNQELRHHRLEWLTSSESLAWMPSAAGAFVGTYSHVALDSLMHADMRPWVPISDSNPLLSLISLEALHGSCIVAGIAGMAVWVALHAVSRRRKPVSEEGDGAR